VEHFCVKFGDHSSVFFELWCEKTDRQTGAAENPTTFGRRTVSLELSTCYITWHRHLTCTVQKTFKDTLVCLGLQRIVTVAFCAVYEYSYLLTATAVGMDNDQFSGPSRAIGRLCVWQQLLSIWLLARWFILTVPIYLGLGQSSSSQEGTRPHRLWLFVSGQSSRRKYFPPATWLINVFIIRTVSFFLPREAQLYTHSAPYAVKTFVCLSCIIFKR